MQTNIKHSPERLTRHSEWQQIYDKTHNNFVFLRSAPSDPPGPLSPRHWEDYSKIEYNTSRYL